MFNFPATMFSSASGYIANAVDYDGSTNYLLRGAGLTGAVDGAQGILSAWVRFDGGDGSVLRLLNNSVGTVVVGKRADNKIVVEVYNAAASSILIFATVNTYTASATWLNILASWDIGFGAGSKLSNLYITDISDKNVDTDLGVASVVDYTASDWSVGATTAIGAFFNGCVAEVYFNIATYLDFTNSANRRKFISATGKPVNLGADGSTPTGLSPILYLKNPAASIGTNSGSGGNMSANGVFNNCSTSPSS